MHAMEAAAVSPLSTRSRYALLLLAAGLSPDEASERLRDRLGIELSPRYLRNLRYRESARAFVEQVSPLVLQSTIAQLLAPVVADGS